MAYRLRILSPAEAKTFACMTFPAYVPLLGKSVLAVGAYSNKEPAGLALVSLLPDHAGAELLSLYVDFPHRFRGMGTVLLGHVEKTLSRAKKVSIHTTWSETLLGADSFKRVLAKSGWTKPYKRMLTLRGDMDGDFGREVLEKYSKYKEPCCLPRKYSLTHWHDMTMADRTFILSKQGCLHWYEPDANPFRDESTMEPATSLLLRKDDEIVGWLTVHRTAPDTLRYTNVFIRADLKRAGAVSIAMVTHAFWVHLAEGTPKLTMAVLKENEPLIRMFVSRMSCARLSWTWGAGKRIGN
jgi:GNAT superfamily N-acetyltransferase